MSEYVYATDEHKGHWLTGEEIVRCRDCRLRDDFKYCDRLGFKVGDYGYCAWPVRKD